MFDLSSRTAKLVFGGLLIVIGFYLFFPIYWMLASSLKGNAELYQIIPTLIPTQPTLAHYWSAIAESRLLVYRARRSTPPWRSMRASVSPNTATRGGSRSCCSCCRRRCSRSACC